MSERMVLTDLTAVSMSDRADSAVVDVLTEVVVAFRPMAPRDMEFTVMLKRSTEELEPAPMCSTEAAPPDTPKEPAAPSSRVMPLYEAELEIRVISDISWPNSLFV